MHKAGFSRIWRGVLGLSILSVLSASSDPVNKDGISWELRAEPLRELKVKDTISLGEYGADPTATSNSLPAFAKIPQLIAAADGPVEISLPRGTYWLDTDEDVSQLVFIKRQHNFVFNGNGSEILIRNPRAGLFNIEACSNVILKGFSVDYDPLPFTQGKVAGINTDEKYVEVELSEGFPMMSEPYFEKARDPLSGIRNPNDFRRTKPGQPHVISVRKFEHVSGRKFRVFNWSPHEFENVEMGDPFWYVARENQHNLFFVDQNTDLTVMDVTAYASPAVFVGGGFNTRINILDCNVLLKPGRMISANADLGNFFCNRVGPWIEGCRFEGCIDDFINCYGWVTRIKEIVSPKEVRLYQPFGPKPMAAQFAGSPVSIIDVETGRTRYRGTVMAFDGVNVAFNKKLGHHPFRLLNPSEDIPKDRVSWSSGYFEADALVFEGWMSGNCVIRNNTFVHGHRFGIILPTQYGLVENNRFDDMSASAIVVQNRMNEGPEVIRYHARGDIVIRGNAISNCNASLTYAHQNIEGDIHVAFQTRHLEDAESYELRNIRIEDNTIYNWRQTGIHVGSTDGVVIRGNKLLSDKSTPLCGPKSYNRDVVNAGITVRKSRNVVVENNTVSDPRKVDPVYIEKGTGTAVRVKGNM